MSVMESIKKVQIQSRKDKNTVASSVLTTLLGEASMVGKSDGNRETTDLEVFAIIKKFIKGIDETITIISSKEGSMEKLDVLQKEKEILTSFLPKQMSEDELRVEMKKIIEANSLVAPKGMGVLMKELKDRHNGLYDGSVASKLAKELL